VRIVQVLGTNGSGKSALLRALAHYGGGLLGVEGVDTTCPYTLNYHLRAVCIGDYVTTRYTAPGADRLRSGADRRQALEGAVGIAASRGWTTVAWEGIIIMTRQWPMFYRAHQWDARYVHLTPPLETCYARVEHRSGKPRSTLKGNGQIVASRARGVESMVAWLRTTGAPILSLPEERSPQDHAASLVRWLSALTP
jgi:hypothetical protein